jgi:hypothetical protein
MIKMHKYLPLEKLATLTKKNIEYWERQIYQWATLDSIQGFIDGTHLFYSTDIQQIKLLLDKWVVVIIVVIVVYRKKSPNPDSDDDRLKAGA